MKSAHYGCRHIIACIIRAGEWSIDHVKELNAPYRREVDVGKFFREDRNLLAGSDELGGRQLLSIWLAQKGSLGRRL